MVLIKTIAQTVTIDETRDMYYASQQTSCGYVPNYAVEPYL